MDILKLKIELLNDFKKENPTPQEMKAFYKGIIWLENALEINNNTRLNDDVEEKWIIRLLINKNNNLLKEKDFYFKQNKMHLGKYKNMLQMNKDERRKIRKDEEIKRLEKKIEELQRNNNELIIKINKNSLQ